MGFIIGLLTFLLVLDCVALVLLVLIQLPKKEAGAGLAFGGAASDALFGAGSGTVLTKITKYTAGIFFALAIFLSAIETRYVKSGSSNLLKNMAAPATMPVLPGSETAATPAPTGTNVTLLTPTAESTNLPVAPPSTNVTSPSPAK